MGDPTALYSLLDRGGILALFVVFLWGLIQGWWVLGAYHKETMAALQAQLSEAVKQRDMWMDAALRSTGLATQATGLAERYGRQSGPPQGYGSPQGYGGQGGQPPQQQYGPPQQQRPPQGPPQPGPRDDEQNPPPQGPWQQP